MAGLVFALGLTVRAEELPGRTMPDEGQEHVAEGTPVRYKSYPPTSGPHYPRWVPWGFYDREIPEPYWVHNLEHGGIVLLYKCDSPCPDLRADLEALHRSLPPSRHGNVKLVILPYPRLRQHLAILAWSWIEEIGQFDFGRIERFYRAHVDRGPEEVP